MLSVKMQTEPLQAIGFLRADFIRTTDFVPELEQKRGQPAHPAPGHADEMNFVPRVSEHLCKIDIKLRGHGSYIFPSLQRRGSPHLSARGANNFQTSAEVSGCHRSIP